MLNYGASGTFLTGIRGNSIVGNYVVSGTGATGGLLYNTLTGTWSPMPVATPDGVNYPGASGSSPYGPSFGNIGGVLRVVGTYLPPGSSYDRSYLYDGAAPPEAALAQLAFPDASPSNPTLFTIAHSTFGDTVVGDYDTRLATGNAMIYTISTGTYTTNNKPGAASTTAYGVYANMIAGGYFDVPGGGIGAEHGYLYNRTTDTWTQYDHPGAVVTHLEGITSAGRSGEYNMVANWVTVDGVAHAGVLHVDALGIATWYEINIPGATVVSSNSAYGDQVVGIYLMPGSATPNGYVATLDGIYNPIRNTGTLNFSTDNASALSGTPGDDIVNSGTVNVSGNLGIGMRGDTYSVLTNTGTVTSSGIAGAAVDLHGLYGTFLNYGTLRTTIESDAIRSGLDASGTVIVNMGIVDGRIAATAGLDKRFENSGWLGVSGTGLSITHLFGGTFVQTAAGTLSLRVTQGSNDFFGIAGVARLAGTLEVPFQTSDLSKSYRLLAATDGTTGAFTSLTTPGLPALYATSLSYTGTEVDLNVAAGMASLPGTTQNQRAVGAVLDNVINSGAGNSLAPLPTGLSALYDLSAAQLPQALGMLSGEAYASETSVLAGDGIYGRGAVLSRMRQANYGAASGPLSALAYGGPSQATMTSPAGAALAYATKAPAALAQSVGTAWIQGFGGRATLDGNGNAAGVDETIGGVIGGADIRVGDWQVGAALGYTNSNAAVDSYGSNSEVNSMLVALYGVTSTGPWSLRLGASYAFNQIDTARTIIFPGFLQQANAQYDGGTTQVFAEAGYGFALQAIALEPYAGLAWLHLVTDGFSETGAGIANLTGGSTASDLGYTSLGLRAATSMALTGGMALSPHVSAAWQYAFGDLNPVTQMAFSAIPGTGFSVAGVPLARNTALVEAGADLHLTAQARLGLSYVGQFADSVTVNAVQANLAWRF